METHRITHNLDNSASLRSGQQLHPQTTLEERYLIKGVVGVGGMGAVYCAQDLHFPNVVKLVAVKEMINHAPDPLVRQTIVRNFEREANLLATLDHRAIPRIYDYFTLDERSYLVLEYIHGKDLETFLAETPGFIGEEQLIAWGIELCDVLAYLHNHKPEPIVFRDMKPSNVMINQHGHVILVDFGIAKPFQTGQRGTMIGTEGYSPPEQYRGEATPLADIYSLGASLHHLLTRRDPRLEPPFSFKDRPICKLNPDVSPGLEAVINTALEYAPGARFSSAEAMRDALVNVAGAASPHPRIFSPAAGQPQPGESLQPLWSFLCADEIRGTPTCREGFLYFGSYDNHLYALQAASGEFAWKYPTDGGIVSRPAVYEDNIYFGSEDHRLHVISTFNGRINWTYFTKGPIRSSPRIAEGHVFIGSDDGCLHAVNALSGRCAWQFESGAPIRSTPLVDHEFVYFGNEGRDLFCLDFGGTVKWRFSARRALTSSPIIHKGVVYFASVDANLYALEANTGWALWRFRLGKASISTPCIGEDLLSIGAVDGVIYSVEAGSSREVWRYATQRQVTGSPIQYKDSLYCGSVDGHLYCLDQSTGRLNWKFKTEGMITGTPVADNDIIYVGSTDHRIYALSAHGC